ncbi:MAG TPA: hypothetical protein EYO94_07985 [Acidobacteria bacterium]|nr:hypothetical protein [Acidobacteriota bacterium]
MTMLDRMRQHKRWLKWSLGLVVLAFIAIIPGVSMSPMTDPTLPSNVIARVGEHEISLLQFQQIYMQQLNNYRLQSGGDVSEEILRSLGIDRQIIQQLIDEYAAITEAERLGLVVGDAEVRERIITLPQLQVDGQFIGDSAYYQLLQTQQPPINPTQFEEEIRQQIMLERLQTAVTSWMTVTDEEIAEEHRRRNEKVKVNIISFRASEFRDEAEATDDDISLLYEEEAANYEVPEKRQLRFLLVDESEIFDSLTVTDDEVRQYYDTNISQYQTPGQVRASHILLRVDDEDTEEEVVEHAADLATQARGGADFAELAREHSDDEGTAENGGDLGLFGRGRMVPEFEAAAFEMNEGDISDPVKSAFGYHVIQVTEKQEEITQPFETVQTTIQNLLKQERASSRSTALSRAIAAEVETPEDLAQAAASRGYELQESGFAARGEPILGLGMAPQVSAQAFSIEPNEVAGVDTPSGPAFITVIATQDPYIPPIEEVRDRVREDVIRKKSLALALERANEAAEVLKSADDFVSAAETAEFAVGTSELVARGASFPQVGISSPVEAVAFAMEPGAVSDVIQAANSAAIVHLVEKEDASEDDLATNQDALRNELLFSRQNQFFSAYMENAKERLDIDIDLEVLDQALNPV